MVPRDRVGEVWPKVAPWLQQALDRGAGEYALEDLEDYVRHGFAELFIAADPQGLMAAAVAQIQDYPRTSLVGLLAAGGRQMAGVSAMWPVVRAYAKERGCSGVRFYGRRGWARVGGRTLPPGWRHMQDVIFLPLEA